MYYNNIADIFNRSIDYKHIHHLFVNWRYSQDCQLNIMVMVMSFYCSTILQQGEYRQKLGHDRHTLLHVAWVYFMVHMRNWYLLNGAALHTLCLNKDLTIIIWNYY